MPREIQVKSVLNKSKRRDHWFLDDYTMNPYGSCSFNCLYCYIRGSKYGSNLSEQLTVKTNALEVLERQLSSRAKKGEFGFIVLSSATDPYIKVEEKYQLTRGALEIILKYRFPVHIITKSTMVSRDFDLLHEIDRRAILPSDLNWIGRGSILTFSFSCLDDQIGKVFEPGAPQPSERLQALQQSVEQNFLSGVSLMPLLPYISDTGEQLDMYFNDFKELGALYLFPAGTTLFGSGKGSSRDLVFAAIEKHYPEHIARYQKLFGQSDSLPTYYHQAFQRKVRALSLQYGLPLSIQEAVRK
ncbi:MAG: radical SAM protein [Bacteroidetes bacterium]|nr:MAG: radical SAM protein [Bacteroidota bacterium]